jgi:peptide/nickel transport system permease protein
MAKFIYQRLIGLAVTLFVVSIIVFVIMELPPGDYAERYLFRKFAGSAATINEADLINVRQQFGLDRPAHVRYLKWVIGIVTRFDFGTSFAYGATVNKVIGDRLWLTLAILFSTLIITYVLAIPIAIYAAIRQHSITDYTLTVFSYLGLALPNFLTALILLYISVTFFDTTVGGLFSKNFEQEPWSIAKAFDLLKHLMVPTVVLAWSATAFQLQTVRATMLDELNKPSIEAARARGIPEKRLLLKYPARLAINPVVATIGFDINRIFSALPIVALVLCLPEIGELLLQSYLDLDMNVAGAILLMLTFLIVVMNFFSDIIQAYLDPRIKLDTGKQ